MVANEYLLNPLSKIFVIYVIQVLEIFVLPFYQHNTLEAVLQRGEKLDDLVSKSEGLSAQSKAFYKTARKTNSCCSLAP